MVEALRLNTQAVMMGRFYFSGVVEASASDSESERGDDGSTGVGGIAEPPSYTQVSSYFGPLESLRSRVRLTRPYTICRSPACYLSKPML